MENGAKLHLSQPKASLVMVAYQEVPGRQNHRSMVDHHLLMVVWSFYSIICNQPKKNLILEFQSCCKERRNEKKNEPECFKE